MSRDEAGRHDETRMYTDRFFWIAGRGERKEPARLAAPLHRRGPLHVLVFKQRRVPALEIEAARPRAAAKDLHEHPPVLELDHAFLADEVGRGLFAVDVK